METINNNDFPNSLMVLTRKEKYALWKIRSGNSGAALAKLCGISEPVFSKMIHGDSMPAWHYQTLLAAGVPADCLPSPVVKKKGPKPKGFAYLEAASWAAKNS